MDQSKSAILATLCYSDIFDYPLTKSQLWRYLLIQKPKIKMKNFEELLEELIKLKKIETKENYYFLPKRNKIVKLRQDRQKISDKKIQKAKSIALIISHIPTVMLIGISGSLSMQNAEKNDDIDFFIIAKKNTIWITRLLILLLLQIKQVRRKRESKISKDTICVNMLLDTYHMVFPKSRQNIYTAHEIMQMKMLFSRGITYEIFFKKNKWIADFLPNSYPINALVAFANKPFETSSFLQIFESFAKIPQLLYMKKHITTETIQNGFIAFHPFDYSNYVLDLWQKNKEKYLR